MAMQNKTVVLSVFFSLFLFNPIKSQYIVTQESARVEVRDLKGKYIAGGYYPGLQEMVQGCDMVVLRFVSDKVEVRSMTLKHIASRYCTGLKKISTSNNKVILYYRRGRIEVRDKKLTYISSHYQ